MAQPTIRNTFQKIDPSEYVEGPAEILNAIRAGEVDAFVVCDPDCDRVYTLGSGEPPYRRMIEEMREGAALLNPDGDILYCNSHFAQLVGATAQDLVMVPISRWVSPENRPAFEDCLERGKRDRVNVESQLVSNRGETTPVMFTASPIPVDGISVICVIVTDLSFQHRTESERAARTEAERANRLKDEYLATVSHELRNPLNVIVSWAAMLRARTLDSALVTRGLDAIERSARAQAKIIDDLLDMNRISSGNLRLEVKTFDLTGVASSVTETMLHAANDRKIKVEMSLEPVFVSGDPSRLQQAVGNLLSNAIKFTPEGGSINISVLQHQGKACLRVVDTGEGIDRDFLPHVFERFRQADGALTRRRSGLGLGLAIVKQLVELHGGTVSADSAGLGQGASFVVTLPLAMQPEPGDSPDGIASIADVSGFVPDLSGVCVMVVDDDPDSCEAVRRFLIAHHAKVEVASSVEEASTEMARVFPDVLISDISMPEVDGYDLIRKVRAMEKDRHRRIHAIALTALARPEDRDRALGAGYDRHISKPVEPSALASLIKALYSAKAPENSDPH